MSKIGKQPIVIPEGVIVQMNDSIFQVQGRNGSLSVRLLPGIKVHLTPHEITFTCENDGKQTINNWGTMRALVANAIAGASSDFTKELNIEGVGYRAEVQGENLILNVGFSHTVNFPIPQGVKISVDKNQIKILGSDKQIVGETAAKIRRIKKPEPYKGKGIMYKGEVIRRKAGKKAAGSA